MPEYVIVGIIFAAGISIGSFLNVCIYRLPRHGMLGFQDLPGAGTDREALWQQLIDSDIIDEEGVLTAAVYTQGLSAEQAEHIPVFARREAVRLIQQSRDISIDKPRRSFCPRCRAQIAWFDNIPIFSYLALLGKCRACRQPISIRYALVEFLSGVGTVVLYHFFGFSLQFYIFVPLTFALIVATFIDFDFQIIPDEITLGGLAVGLLLSLVFPHLHGVSNHGWGLLQGVFGMLAGGGSIYLIGKFGELLFKKESMGGGDVKFLAMIGSLLGWQMALLIFFLAPFFGAVVGIIMKLRHGAEVIPYGPYLSLATFLVLLWGRQILQYYIVSSY